MWILILIFSLLVASAILVVIYEDEVKAVAVKELNKRLKTEVRIDPKDIDLTFISTFPKCAIQFKNIAAMEALKKKNRDTLFFAGNLKLLFNLKDIFNKKYIVKQLLLKDAWCSLQVDKNGKENYLIWESAPGGTVTAESDSLQFKLDDIHIQNFHFKYKNAQKKIKTDLKVKDLNFAGNFSENSFNMESKGEMLVNNIQVEKTHYVSDKNLKLDLVLSVEGNKYQIKKSEIALNQMNFSMEGNLSFKDSLENLSLNYMAKNLDISSVLSLLPEKYTARVNEYKSDGEFYASGKLDYSTQKPLAISSVFGIKKASIEYSKGNSRLDDVLLDGELKLSKNNSFLNLKNISAKLNGETFSGNFLMKDFNDPFIELNANGKFNLQKVYEFWPIDTLEKLEGTLMVEGNMSGMLSEFKRNTFSDKLSVNLTMEVENLKTKFRKDENEFAVESGKIIARERDIRVDHFKLYRGKSDVSLSGEVPGMFNYILNSKAPLVIKGNLSSKKFVMEDFIFSSAASSSAKAGSEQEFHVPENVQLYLDADVESFSFGKLQASKIRGNFELKNQKAMISEMRFETMEGSGVIDALADASGKQLELTLQSEINHINIKQMFSAFNNFGQSTLLDENINGHVTATVEFSGNWDRKLNSDLNSVKSVIELNIAGGELNDFKPLESLSKFIELNDLKKIKFSDLSSRLEIRNSNILIPQTTIKNSALNIDFSGTHNFNNDIDYHIRLLISELLAKKRKAKDDEFGPEENDPENRRSAYIHMYGNINDIHLAYDRKGLKQKIKEDLQAEKQTLKQILKEEFGSFKKDSSSRKNDGKATQKWELEKPDNKKDKKTLEPKKKDDDGDF